MNTIEHKDFSSRYPAPVSDQTITMTSGGLNQEYFDRTPGPREFMEILLRRKRILLVCVLSFTTLALLASVLPQPVYKSTGVIDVSTGSAKVTKFEDISYNSLKSEEYIVTQVELLKSETLAGRVIEKLHLGQNPEFNSWLPMDESKVTLLMRMQRAKSYVIGQILNSVKAIQNGVTALVDAVLGRPQASEGEQEVNPELMKLMEWRSMLGLFSGSLEVEQKPSTNIITVSFESTSPAIARDVVNTLIQEYSGWDMDRRIDAAGAAKKQLEKQINLSRMDVDRSETEANRFAREKGIVSLDSKMNLVYQQLEKINEALAKAETERIQKSQVYDHAKDSDLSASPLVLQNSMIQALKQQYIEMMGEYEKLRVFYKPDYPNVKNIKAKMTDINRKIESEQQRILESFKNDYLAVLKTEKALQGTAEEKKLLALQLNDYATHYKNLEREIEINKSIFKSLLERSKEIDANVGTELGNIRVVDLAPLPLRPDRPKTFRNVLLGMMLGLFGGIGLALLREYMDNTIRRVDDVSDNHFIPILGVVPLVEGKKEIKSLHSFVQGSPASLYSEVIRVIKASILFSIPKGQSVKSLLVTSTAVGEGKTTITSNLAQAFAASGEKVLVIDADMRKGSLSRALAVNGNMFGLNDYLIGHKKLNDIIQKTATQDLFLVSSGTICSMPAELLSRDQMNTLIEECSQCFDRIIVDSPPFGVFADTLFLASKVDAVVLVTALGKAHHEDIRTFRNQILNANGNLIGSIVNMLDIGRYNAGYHYKQYRNYCARPPVRSDS